MPIADFFNNIGGLNVTDSPFMVKDTQATGQSYNYDYAKTGAISKTLGHSRGASADAQLKTLGLVEYNPVNSVVKKIVRAAGTKLQLVNTDTLLVSSNLTDDTSGAATDFLAAGSTQPVVGRNFNTGSTSVTTWMAGGGMTNLYGYTGGTKVTANGVPAPTGSISLAQSAAAATFPATGTYFYAIGLRKQLTQALSNAALDNSINLSATTNKVTITLPSVDTTKYDKFYIYRSAVSGVTGFTTGDLVAIIDSTSATYDDTGGYTANAQVIPRAGGTTDNSVLPAGTYKYVTTFKRRLVTVQDSVVYLSDFGKPESWPTGNRITIPSGGPITSVSFIGSITPFGSATDEFLAIHKDSETWIVTGNDLTDWELKFVDRVGCAGQSLVVNLNGFLAWMDYRGIYLWDGHAKPIYTSRPIEAFFEADGDIDKTRLSQGWGIYAERVNQVEWRVSSRIKGPQKLSIKMDTRFTIPQVSDEFDKRVLDGVFITDTDYSFYGGVASRISGTAEVIYAGDDVGYLYTLRNAPANPGSTGVQFTYQSRPLDMGNPHKIKKYKRVIVWLERIVEADLTLNYWAQYRNRNTQMSTIKAPIGPTSTVLPSLWDIAYWDVGFWDDYVPDVGFVEFNLHSEENNAEGSSITLQFQQNDPSVPVRIYGYSVEYEEMGDITAYGV